MSAQTSIESLDRNIHQANEWLAALTAELGEDRQGNYRALRAFLHVLRDRLTLEEGAHLAAQLPHLWRGIFYEAWVPARIPDTYRDRGTFLQRFAEEAQLTGSTEASIAAEACAKVLREHIEPGEWEHVLSVLPEKIGVLLR